MQYFTEDTAVRYVAETKKNDIIIHYQNLSKIKWLPTVEQFSTDERKAPSLVYTFL